MAPFLLLPDVRRVALASAAAVLVVVAAWWLLRPAPAPIEQVLPRAGLAAAAEPGSVLSPGAAPGPTSTSEAHAPDLVVQAAGAVHKPGVYRLEPGARIDDLVSEAGGFSPGADPDRVNLASPLVDGQRVWIPAVGEWSPPVVVAGDDGGGPAAGVGSEGTSAVSGTGGSGATGDAVDPIDLNRASAAELDELPGVGPATAAAILSYRDQHGPFASVEALLEVRGIGEAKLEAIRPLVRIGP